MIKIVTYVTTLFATSATIMNLDLVHSVELRPVLMVVESANVTVCILGVYWQNLVLVHTDVMIVLDLHGVDALGVLADTICSMVCVKTIVLLDTLQTETIVMKMMALFLICN